MRYSRMSRRKSQGGRKWIGVLLIGGLLIYLAAAGYLGKAYSQWIAPWIMERAAQTQEGETTPLPEESAPAETGAPSGAAPEHVQIQMDGYTLYCLQLGAFAEEANAEDLAASLKGMGAAGYIVEDTYFRVLASGYKSEADAESVAERIRTEDEMEVGIYPMSCAGLNIEITAPADIAEGLKTIVADWEQMTDEWYDAFVRMDRGEWTVNEVTDMLSGQNATLQAHIAELSAYGETVAANPVIDGLGDLYGAHAARVNEMIVKVRKENTVEISASLMYNYIDMNEAYRQFVQQAGVTG